MFIRASENLEANEKPEQLLRIYFLRESKKGGKGEKRGWKKFPDSNLKYNIEYYNNVPVGFLFEMDTRAALGVLAVFVLHFFD